MLAREDKVGELKTESGRFFVVPEEFMYELMGARDLDGEVEAGARVCEAGGELVDLDTGVMVPAKVTVVRKWRVDRDGENEAVVEIRPSDLAGHRFLMRGEPTREEYILRRAREMGVSGGAMVPFFRQFADEYRELTSS